MAGFSPKWDRILGEDEAHGASVSGSSSAQVLPMTEEQMAAVEKHPLGFAPPAEAVTKSGRTPRKKKA